MGYVAAAYLAVALLFAAYAATLVGRQRELQRRVRDISGGRSA